MRVEVINTGTELLLGQVINTHLGYLGERLFELDLRIEHQVCVPDGDPIRGALQEAFGRCEIILMTGGLGPTSDDVSREITAELYELELEMDPQLLSELEKFFARRGAKMSDENRRQAMVPKGARVLPNPRGTAPGLYVPAARGRPHVFLLPGPPRELEPMFEAQVVPFLKDIAGIQEEKQCRNYKIFGVGESRVAAELESRLDAIEGLEHGYCARSGEVDLRCIASARVLEEIDTLVRKTFGAHLVSSDDAALEEVVVRMLVDRRETLATAESCTGGQIANLLTDVPGASEVFVEGFVTYANQAKIDLLGVGAELLEAHGAVSAPVAAAMAEGCLERAGTDHAIAVTGIAGPGGGTEEKPVGTVFLAMKSREEPVYVKKIFYPTDRATFKRMIARRALDFLRRRLSGIALD